MKCQVFPGCEQTGIPSLDGNVRCIQHSRVLKSGAYLYPLASQPQRRECPECGRKHEGDFLKTEMGGYLYDPKYTVAQENKLFSDYEEHINHEIDVMRGK